jgi:hypothetical protein
MVLTSVVVFAAKFIAQRVYTNDCRNTVVKYPVTNVILVYCGEVQKFYGRVSERVWRHKNILQYRVLKLVRRGVVY